MQGAGRTGSGGAECSSSGLSFGEYIGSPEASGRAAWWRCIPVPTEGARTGQDTGRLVAYLLLSPSPLHGLGPGPTFHQLGGLQLEAQASVRGPASAAQTTCCSCSTAPVGLRESVGRRPPRGPHPQPVLAEPGSSLQKFGGLAACSSLALPGPGPVVSAAGPPVRSVDCTSRLGRPADSGLQSVQTAWTAADSPQTGRGAVQCCSAPLQRLHRHYNASSAWIPVPAAVIKTLLISDCISASWVSAVCKAQCQSWMQLRGGVL